MQGWDTGGNGRLSVTPPQPQGTNNHSVRVSCRLQHTYHDYHVFIPSLENNSITFQVLTTIKPRKPTTASNRCGLIPLFWAQLHPEASLPQALAPGDYSRNEPPEGWPREGGSFTAHRGNCRVGDRPRGPGTRQHPLPPPPDSRPHLSGSLPISRPPTKMDRKQTGLINERWVAVWEGRSPKFSSPTLT